MAGERVRVGVIGAGGFAEQCHIPGLQAHRQAEVVALCARTRDRVERMAERFSVREVFTDYRELIASPDIDAVTVATPDALHRQVALAALAAGKHVFCDKPLAKNVEEAEQMAEAARRSGLVAMVAFTFRYTHALLTLRRLVREGAIGDPFFVNMQVHWGGVGYGRKNLTWREQADQSAAGIWGDGASHLFDALAFVLAPAQEVCAQMMVVPREEGQSQPDNPDLATCLARLRFDGSGSSPSGYADREAGTVHAALLTSRVEHPRAGGDGVYVVGTRGALDGTLTRGLRERVSLLRDGGGWEDVPLPAEAGGNEALACDRMLGAFVEAVLRGGPGPDDADFGAGLHAQRAIEAGLRSARSGRWETV